MLALPLRAGHEPPEPEGVAPQQTSRGSLPDSSAQGSLRSDVLKSMALGAPQRPALLGWECQWAGSVWGWLRLKVTVELELPLEQACRQKPLTQDLDRRQGTLVQGSVWCERH